MKKASIGDERIEKQLANDWGTKNANKVFVSENDWKKYLIGRRKEN